MSLCLCQMKDPGPALEIKQLWFWMNNMSELTEGDITLAAEEVIMDILLENPR